jgi:hypothetical protein
MTQGPNCLLHLSKDLPLLSESLKLRDEFFTFLSAYIRESLPNLLLNNGREASFMNIVHPFLGRLSNSEEYDYGQKVAIIRKYLNIIIEEGEKFSHIAVQFSKPGIGFVFVEYSHTQSGQQSLEAFEILKRDLDNLGIKFASDTKITFFCDPVANNCIVITEKGSLFTLASMTAYGYARLILHADKGDLDYSNFNSENVNTMNITP